MPLYSRVASIAVGQPGQESVLLDGADFSFEIEKFAEGKLSVGRADVYGLSETTRGRIKAGRDVMVVMAGYEESKDMARLCCALDVIDVRVEHKPPDVITTISAGDGAHTTRGKKISVSYGRRTVKQILRDVATKMGAALQDPQLRDIDDATYQTGFADAGMASDILDRLCGRVGATWSFQDGKLQIAPDDAPITSQAVLLSSETGLIGRPEPRHRVQSVYVPIVRPGWIVTSLLNPLIVPNGRVRLKSERSNVDAVYRVLSVKHSGDTRGQQWYTVADIAEW